MRFLLILLCLSLPLCSASLFQIDSVPDLQGNAEIRHGNIDSAQSILSRCSAVNQDYNLLKQAEIQMLKKDYSEAKRYLLAVISRSYDLAPYAYRRIGDIELLQFDPAQAIVSYRTAAEKTELKPYRYLMVNRADSIAKVYESQLKSSGWHSLSYRDTVIAKEPVIDEVFEGFKRCLEQGVTEVQFDSLFAEAGKAGKLMNLKKAIVDTNCIREPFGVKKIYDQARYLNDVGAYVEASRWINFAANRVGFVDSVDQKSYLEFRANLNYILKNWENVTKYTEPYFAAYGYTSDLLFKTARSYRNAGNDSIADLRYTDFVYRYPNAQESRDILWYQAWQAEENGQFDAAVVRFKNIATIIPDYKYADDAAFRVGLNQFRMKKFSEAVVSFQNFAMKYPNSDLAPGASYWIGRSYSALENDSLSKQFYLKTSEEWPLDYYGWRARQAMGTQDSFTFSRIPFASWFEQVRQISRDPADSLAPKNSISRFRAAVQLGTLGYKDEARLLIEPFETRAGKNPAQLFELSRFYEIIDQDHKAFKLSKSLYYSLPNSLKKAMPAEFLSRLYPQAYDEYVLSAVVKFGVNEHLVRSIMRQESMFNATIKSPVGAVGLMQIMPYTGKQIAQSLESTYADSDLLNPATNVTFGTYYIGQLLKQNDGDFVKAIASYNGGPHNVKKWAERNSDVVSDEPFFAECIGFSETRNYVKRVLENYWIYSALDQAK